MAAEVPFKEGNLRVPVEPTPWPSDRKKRVSVNCFGIGGSNAHVSEINNHCRCQN